MTEKNPALVVLGEDTEHKPHACWFSDADAELATKAAYLMGFHAVRLAVQKLRDAALELPAGKVFASGKAFCPFVKRDIYDKFAGLIGTDQEVALPPQEALARPGA